MAIDEDPIKTITRFDEIIHGYQPGDIIQVTVKRGSRRLNFDVPLGFRYMNRVNYELSPMMSTMEDVLSSKQPVRIAIYVDKIINTHATAPGHYNQYQFEQWKEGTKNQRYSFLEQALISAFGKYTHFFLVDRQSLKQVMDEHKLSMSGIVSKESRTKLGEMLGLTHMIIIDFSRYQYKPKMVYDVERMRLIEIDTGRVLQSVSINYYVPV